MRRLIITAVCAASLGAPAEPTNTVDVTRIVVTATRNLTPVRSIAKNPSVITSKDLENGRYSSIPEALQKKAGVFISNISDNPSTAYVNLRGFGGDAPHGKTLVLLNGRKLNRPDMATINWAQIPMQAVERIEVIRGPNSVLYGDHAVGGVINIITKEPSEIPQTTFTASIASYETYEQTLTTSGKINGLGYVATLGHQSGDGYRDRSEYDALSGSLRLSGNVTDRISTYVEVSTVKEQHQLPGALNRTQLQQNRQQAINQNDAVREEYLHLQAGVEALLTDDVVFNLDGGISQKDLEADIASWFSYYNYKIDTYTLSPKFTLLMPLFDMNNELVAGIDLSKETLDTQRFSDKGRSILATDTEIERKLIAGYIADTLHLTDSLLLSGGLRFEKNKLDIHHTGAPSFSQNTSETEEAWQVALTWLPTDTLKVFAGIDRTYRYPAFDEQISYTGYGSDGFNSDLKPETGINYEFGIEYLPASNLVIQATVFRTDMEDEIAWGAGQNENLDETTHRGIELSGAYTHELFALDAYYTWMQSEFSAGPNQGNEIPWVPQNQFDINLALFLTDALTLNTHMSYVGSMFQSGDNANSGANKQSEYALFDLLLQYDLPIDNVEATLFAGINNVFATEYNYLVSWGGYYPAPERTYKVGITATF